MVAAGAAAAVAAWVASADSPELWEALEVLMAAAQQPSHSLVLSAVLCLLSAAAAVLLYRWWSTAPVYLLDFSVRRPDDSWQTTRLAAYFRAAAKDFGRTELDFQAKMLWSSAMGNETYVPPWMLVEAGECEDTSLEKARLEFDMVVVEAVRDLLAKTGVTPDEIGVIVVNCSLFCPTPSLSAHIINQLNMSPTTLSYNLGGMGCSASPIAVDLARKVLELTPNTYALVVSTENITQNKYKGKERSMLIPNVLFRAGGAAMLLTNKRSEAWRCKYRLGVMVRTNLSADPVAYQCCWEMEDSEGHRGVRLSRDLIKVAGKALKSNLTLLGPKVLPLSEKAAFVVNLLRRKLGQKLPPYVPNFTKAADHICIHTGGRGVIDAIQSELGLSDDYVEPSRAALYRYGNVSSSSCWYVLSFIESFRGVKKGDRVLQLAFGSGFKVNSVVWIANRSFRQEHHAWQGFNLEAMYDDLAGLDAELKNVLQLSEQREAERACDTHPPVYTELMWGVAASPLLPAGDGKGGARRGGWLQGRRGGGVPGALLRVALNLALLLLLALALQNRSRAYFARQRAAWAGGSAAGGGGHAVALHAPGGAPGGGAGGGEPDPAWLPPPWVGSPPALDATACTPQLLVIGGMKCGTSALFHYLNGTVPRSPKAAKAPGASWSPPAFGDDQVFLNGTPASAAYCARFYGLPDAARRFHPGVIGSIVTKEVHFFDQDPVTVATRSREYFAKFAGVAPGDDPAARSCAWPAAAGLSPGDAPGLVRMEATVMYMPHPPAARLVADTLPGVRLVALLREPATRALSSINMVAQRGDFAELKGLARASPAYNAAWRAVVVRELRKEMGTVAACFAAGDARADADARIAAVDACMLDGRPRLSERVLDVHLGMYAHHLERWLRVFPADRLLVWSTKAFKEAPWHHMQQLVTWLGLDPAASKARGDFLKLHKRTYPEASLPRGFVSELAAFYAPHNDRLFALLESHGYAAAAAQLRAAWPLELAATIERLEER
ncbi:KCS5 [Scenedesmus sp. PABB004]|nr:KCS5 [Scenedesmus sp. PABB004]